MPLEIMLVVAILLGLSAGCITGLIPGIHINLVAALLVASAPALLPLVGLAPVVAFVVAMSVTHTYLDVIPSVYLGAPDPDMVLGVLPGHRYLLDGLGHHAVRLTQVGSLGATLLSVLLFPLFVIIVRLSESFLNSYLSILLLALVIFLLLHAKRKVGAATILFLGSGALGLLVFALPRLENPLFPMLTGLFGISTLLLSLGDGAQPPPQKRGALLEITPGSTAVAVVTGQAAGFLTAVFPGLGAASAAALSTAFVELKQDSFLVLIGSIGTVNFILSLVTYFVLDKARNGSIVAVRALAGEASLQLVLLGLAATLVAGGFASLILTLGTTRIGEVIGTIDYTKLVKGIIFALIFLAAVLSGWLGLLVLATATALGLLAPLLNVPRIYLMGCLLVPVLGHLFL